MKRKPPQYVIQPTARATRLWHHFADACRWWSNATACASASPPASGIDIPMPIIATMARTQSRTISSCSRAVTASTNWRTTHTHVGNANSAGHREQPAVTNLVLLQLSATILIQRREQLHHRPRLVPKMALGAVGYCTRELDDGDAPAAIAVDPPGGRHSG